MRLAFYAPLKPPDHPAPSGDRRMARLLLDALRLGGHEPELAARLRSYDRDGVLERQTRMATIGAQLAARYVKRQYDIPYAERPRAWLTYHLYHKAPDWIGPRAAARLGIPYIVVEASVANKRAGGPWSLGHEAAIAALARAAAVISLNPNDEPGIAPHVASPDRLRRLNPFLATGPYAAAEAKRGFHRTMLALRHQIPPKTPWLLAVGMMRPGDKLESYRVLAAALTTLKTREWVLITVGDGPARTDVHAALAPLGPRVFHLGARAEEELPAVYAASDLYVWPAVNEAYGMALLEAQATGLPVVAGAVGGVGGIVAHDRTGLLVAPRDAGALAQAAAILLDDPERRTAMSRAAARKAAEEHDLAGAATALDAILRDSCAIGAPA